MTDVNAEIKVETIDPRPEVLEEEADRKRHEEDYTGAYRLYRKAAEAYRQSGDHGQSALCFAFAASCWNLNIGGRRLFNASAAYEEAARQAEKSGDLEYAALLMKYAALNHEKDGESTGYSEAFYVHKEFCRKYLRFRLFAPHRLREVIGGGSARERVRPVRNFFRWISINISWVVWGYGERPARTLGLGIAVIMFMAGMYTLGMLRGAQGTFRPDYLQSLYYSVITFTTVGYGDLTPVGLNKVFAMIESLCGICVMPLFLVGLTRKYLRV